jgi:hypothetical protein
VTGEPRPAEVGQREDRDEHARRARRREERGGNLDIDLVGHGDGESLAPRAPQQPQAHERQGEERRPAQEPDGGVHPHRQQPRPALEVRAEAHGPGRAHARGEHRVGRQASEEAIVDRRVQDEREEHDLDPGDPGQRAVAPARPADERRGDDRGRRAQADREPGQHREQRPAGGRGARARAVADAQRQRGRRREDGGADRVRGDRGRGDQRGRDRPVTSAARVAHGSGTSRRPSAAAITKPRAASAARKSSTATRPPTA